MKSYPSIFHPLKLIAGLCSRLCPLCPYLPGQFITVERWINSTDGSYVGDVLKVKAVDMPFLVVRGYAFTFTLDTRRVIIKHLLQEFVKEATKEMPL